jgi:uncharacterized tellurite resistance protein B-like protein
MIRSLDRKDRLRLMKFVCSFAWADLEIQKEEREFIKRVVRTLDLDADEREMVDEWLEVPPRPEEVDPTDIPVEHRELFRDIAKAVVIADGRVDEEERINLALLDALAR